MIRVGTTVIWLISALAIPASAQVSPEVVERVRSATFQVIGRQCQTANPVVTTATGTGFLAFNRHSIVTALHVVSSCKQISMYDERSHSELRAKLVRTLPKTYLALLQIDAAYNADPLPISQANPSSQEVLRAVGYGEFVTMGDLGLVVQSGASTLDSLLARPLLQQIRDTSDIDTNATIVRFANSLQPGYSGAPIFNSRGQVVAVGAGGLASGQTEASWGWPATEIRQLPNASLTISKKVVTTSTLYFAQHLLSDSQHAPVTCGNLTFEFVRTLPFDQIRKAFEDETIDRVVQASKLDTATVLAFSFDIWMHRKSGATIAVPAGLLLEQSGSMCVARSHTGTLELRLSGGPASGPMEVQAASVLFETRVAQGILQPGMVWSPDLTIGTWFAQERTDGLVSNHKGSFGVDVITGRPPVHVFEALLARSGTFAGVASYNKSVDPMISQCVNWSGSQNCTSAMEHLREWSRFVFAVELSTYTAI